MIIPLFVKKADGDGKDFYYMGLVDPILERINETTIGGKSVVNIPLKMRNTLPENLFNYIVDNC